MRKAYLVVTIALVLGQIAPLLAGRTVAGQVRTHSGPLQTFEEALIERGVDLDQDSLLGALHSGVDPAVLRAISPQVQGPVENPFTGEPVHPEVRIYGTAPLVAGHDVVVVYARRIEGLDEGEGAFSVYFARLREDDRGTWRVRSQQELTESFEVYLEFPGNFLEMEAVVEVLDPGAGQSGRLVHVALWSVLSGTGGVSGGSDLFFHVENGECRLALELRSTYEYSALGSGTFQLKASDLYFRRGTRTRAGQLGVRTAWVSTEEDGRMRRKEEWRLFRYSEGELQEVILPPEFDRSMFLEGRRLSVGEKRRVLPVANQRPE